MAKNPTSSDRRELQPVLDGNSGGKAHSMMSFNPGSQISSEKEHTKDGGRGQQHIQIELKGQNATMKFISSGALKEKVQKKTSVFPQSFEQDKAEKR